MAVKRYSVVAHDWVNLEFIINDLTRRVVGQEVHPTSSPTFAEGTITGDMDIGGDLDVTGDISLDGALTLDTLTASQLVGADADKALVSIPVIGSGLTLSGGNLYWSWLGIDNLSESPDEDSMMVWNGPSAGVLWESGNTLNHTLGFGTEDSPTLAGLNLTNCAVLGANSAVFQPAVDSTTFFQVKNVAGTLNLITVNTINGFVSIGNVLPTRQFHIHDATFPYMHMTSDTTGTTSNDGISIGYDTANSRAIIRNRENTALTFWTNNIRYLTILNNGYLGIIETNPETPIELTHATPYQTFHNSTHEDTDEGRESRIIAKGEQSGGEETTLGMIEFSHDGTGDDQKGKIGIYTNDGSDGDSPTLRMTIDSDGLVDAVGDFTAGTIQADNGADYDGLLSGITNITIVGGVITAVS